MHVKDKNRLEARLLGHMTHNFLTAQESTCPICKAPPGKACYEWQRTSYKGYEYDIKKTVRTHSKRYKEGKAMSTRIKPHPCKYCGNETTNGLFCSRFCWSHSKKPKGEETPHQYNDDYTVSKTFDSVALDLSSQELKV